VCDGGSSDDTESVVKIYGAEYFYRKWDDKYHEQDNRLLRQCKTGDWIMILDDDEHPSGLLLSNLRNLIDTAEQTLHNMISLPSLDELDGKLAVSPEDFVIQVESGSRDPFRKYWLFRYDPSVRSYGTPHRSVETIQGWHVFHQPNPYIHKKTTYSFVLNDCVHAWINPLKQEYTPTEANEMYAVLPHFKSSRDIEGWLRNGNVDNQFLDFARKYRSDKRPIRNWWNAYEWLHR